MDVRAQSCLAINETISEMINGSLNRGAGTGPQNSQMVRFDRQDLERLGRFQDRTILTVGPSRSAKVYQQEVTKLACVYPYLMHVVQTVTASHDRYLSASVSTRQTLTETYHLARAAAMINEKLSVPIKPDERDALWAAATLLGVQAFASIEASKPEEAWPLKRPSPFDLEWVRMSYGKKAIWELADPSREGSIFHEVADFHKRECLPSIPHQRAPNLILSALVRLCDLSASSNSESNPYHAAVYNLAPLLDLECNQHTLLRFLSYISYMNPKFQDLLEEKDPRAMILLAYWYAKMWTSQWYIARRARLEGQATCIYLERYYGDCPAIQELLFFPKTKLGLVI